MMKFHFIYGFYAAREMIIKIVVLVFVYIFVYILKYFHIWLQLLLEVEWDKSCSSYLLTLQWLLLWVLFNFASLESFCFSLMKKKASVKFVLKSWFDFEQFQQSTWAFICLCLYYCFDSNCLLTYRKCFLLYFSLLNYFL